MCIRDRSNTLGMTVCSQQIKQNIHIMAAFCNGKRAACVRTFPRASHVAVRKMVIADIFIVLDGYHPPQLARFDNLPDSAEKGGVAQHMTHLSLIHICVISCIPALLEGRI